MFEDQSIIDDDYSILTEMARVSGAQLIILIVDQQSDYAMTGGLRFPNILACFL